MQIYTDAAQAALRQAKRISGQMKHPYTGTEHIFRNPLKINVNGQNHAFRLQFFQYMDLVRCNHSQFLLCQGVGDVFCDHLITAL